MYNNTENESFYFYLANITIISLYVEMVLCYIMNILSATSIICTKSFTTINIIILNLAIADCLYAGLIPFYVRQYQQLKGISINQTKFGCKISLLLDVMCMIVIVLTVMALTIERYGFVTSKNVTTKNSKKIREKYTVFFMLLIWIVAFSFACAKTFWIENFYYQEAESFSCRSTLDKNYELAFTILLWFLAFVFPYIVIILTSGFLIFFLGKWSNLSNLNITYNRCQSYRRQKIKRKSIKFVLLVVFWFLVTWLPLWIYQSIVLLTNNSSIIFMVFNSYTNISVYLGGVLNPILFMILTEHFRGFFSRFKCFNTR